MLDQLLGRSYVFLFQDSSLTPPLLTTFRPAVVNLKPLIRQLPSGMDEASLRYLFQERVVLQRILTTPQLRLSREEVLGILSGEGARLDSLIRTGLLSVYQDHITPGPILVNLIQFSGEHGTTVVYELLELSLRQLTESIRLLPPASDPVRRRQAAQKTYQLLLTVHIRAEAVYSAFQEGQLKDLSTEDLKEEFLNAAAFLRGVLLHSSQHPEWEETQWTLISWLEEAAQGLKDPIISEREEKLRALQQLQGEAFINQTNLPEILREQPFLQIQEGVVVVPWPSLPEFSSDHQTDLTPEFETVQEDIESWKKSGLHLLAWIQSSSDPDESMAAFSRMVAIWADKITWKKSETGAFWEAWPSGSS